MLETEGDTCVHDWCTKEQCHIHVHSMVNRVLPLFLLSAGLSLKRALGDASKSVVRSVRDITPRCPLSAHQISSLNESLSQDTAVTFINYASQPLSG